MSAKDLSKSVTELIKTQPKIRSKYLGKEFDGWKVIHVAYVDSSKNRWYYVRKNCVSDKGRKYTMTATLTNRSMTAIGKGRRTIASILENKSKLGLKYKNHIFQNLVMAEFVEE